MERREYVSESGVVYNVRGSDSRGYQIWFRDTDGFEAALLSGRARFEDAQDDLDQYAKQHGWTVRT